MASIWSEKSQARNVLTFIGVCIGVVGGGVGLGMCPSIASLETKANAYQERRLLTNGLENLRVEHDRETQRIYETIKRMQDQQDKAQSNLAAQLDNLDKRTWQILRELKQ